MVRIFASRLGRLVLSIWVVILVTGVSGLNMVPAASKNPNHGGTSSGTTTFSKPSKPSGRSCTTNAPAVFVENTWAWASSGSWGMPGQQLGFQIQVTNYDVGCGSSSFAISASAPSGFSVSVPTSTISVKSTSAGFLWAYVTSPTVIADGDYPLIVTAQRAGTSSGATFTSYYKVYSADTTAPGLFLPNPWDGATISGSSYTFVVTAGDDHAVKGIDLYIDYTYVTTATCDDVSYMCHLDYKWSLQGASGQHTATFESFDWMGNVGAMTVAFTVG